MREAYPLGLRLFALSVGIVIEKSYLNSATLQKERLQMLVWLKQGEVSHRLDLAVRCGRDKATITRWLARYGRGGLSALLATRRAPRASRKIQGEAWAQRKARLAQPEGFHRYQAIQPWLEQTFQLQSDGS